MPNFAGICTTRKGRSCSSHLGSCCTPLTSSTSFFPQLFSPWQGISFIPVLLHSELSSCKPKPSRPWHHVVSLS
ncbi:hypothetical protein SETIT_2G087600v2, partial [Setaria italica]